MRRSLLAGLAVWVLILGTGALQAQPTLYSTSRDDNLLRSLNPATGATTGSVGISLAGWTVAGSTGLATNPLTQDLYSILKLAGRLTQRELVIIDPATGIATSVGNTGDKFATIAFGCDGTLYGLTGDGGAIPETLFTLSLVDATPTVLLALIDGADGEAMALNVDDQLLYRSSGVGAQKFVEFIDPITLDRTRIFPSGFPYREALGLAYDFDAGHFLLCNLAGELVSLTPTGVATFIGTMGFRSKGLAFLPTVGCCRPEPVSQGFWHRQCLGVPAAEGGIDPGRNGHGPKEPTEPKFATALMPPVGVELANLIYETNGSCAGGIHASPNSDPCERATKQLSALLFNLESDRVQDSCPVEVAAGCTSTVLADLVDEIAALINAGDDASCSLASSCADNVNKGEAFVERQLASAAAAPPAAARPTAGRTHPVTPAPAEEPVEVAAPEAPLPAGLLLGLSPGSHDAEAEELEALAEEVVAPREPEDPEVTVHRHLAVLTNNAAPEHAREVAIDSLLTALSGGFAPELRVEIVDTLIPSVDAAYLSLLAEHVWSVRFEARDFEDNALLDETRRLLRRLDAWEEE